MNTKVIVVDDHQIFRTGISTLISDIKNVEVIAQLSNGQEFLSFIEHTLPDVVFMDIRMPVMDGIEATRKALQMVPYLKIIAISMHDQEEYLDQMLVAGAKGFLLKNVKKHELEKAIENLNNNRSYFSSELIDLLAQKAISGKTETDGKTLTEREIDVLELICKGFSTKEIGEKLFLSPRTIEKHRASLLDKTDSKNTATLVAHAIQNNLVKL